jgi:hypothetical protein
VKAAQPATNGDRVGPVIEAARTGLRGAVAVLRDHPDEAAVIALPVLVLALATARHHLNLAEQLAVAVVSVRCGELAGAQYRQWKAQPAIPAPRLRRIT